MALLDWKLEHSVGIAAVDHEHRELIDLINTLHDAFRRRDDRPGAADIFGAIYTGISAHFALEEKFMREHAYDRLAEHKQDHERLLDELRDVMDDFEDGALASDAVLADRLGTWFSGHFQTHDARLHGRLGAHPHGYEL